MISSDSFDELNITKRIQNENLLVNTLSKEELKQCLICYDFSNLDNWFSYSCGHEICLNCYENMLINKLFYCPYCRNNVDNIDLIEDKAPNEKSLYYLVFTIIIFMFTIFIVLSNNNKKNIHIQLNNTDNYYVEQFY